MNNEEKIKQLNAALVIINSIQALNKFVSTTTEIDMLSSDAHEIITDVINAIMES